MTSHGCSGNMRRGQPLHTHNRCMCTLQGWSGARMEVEESALAAALGHEDEGEHKFNLLVKYIVRPSIAKDFIKEFLKVRSPLFAAF
jgi:hypothetical protein